MTMDPLCATVLVRGLEDWLHLADIDWLVRNKFPDSAGPDVPRLAAGVIATLVEGGFVQVGDVTDGGFMEWDDSAEVVRLRIEAQWLALDRAAAPGDVCWVANTAKGDECAREMLRVREQ